MKSENRIVKTLAAFALICGLSVSTQAQMGSGWTPDGETYIPQTSSGCTITSISGGFEFSVPSGQGRAEQRGNNLPTTTTNQWQGFATLKSFPSGSDKICVHQVFGPAPSTPDLILDEATYSGGIELMSLEQGDAFEAQIQVGVQFQLNTIYDPVGNLITIYVNGSQTGTKTPNSGVHYNKYGQYVSSSGTGPATMDWVNIQSWAGGTTSGGGGTTVATPSFSPGGGTYTSTQSVSISDSTSGATIYYTTNGNTPTTSSTVYSGALSVSSTTTIKAIGAKSGDTTSSVASATYTISAATTVATPTFSPAGGTYTSTQSVSLSDSTSGATIYYTTNGNTPTTSSTVYSGAISVSSTTTIKAIGAKSGDTTSSVASTTYTISVSEGPFGGTPAAIPGTVQAENYDTGGQGVAYNVTSINGTDNGYRSDGVDLEVTS
ncbi:MAG TPA: chitobiase/beta-hexosaminidase C-terminal domain-containing protein, partial [Opitutaceae bacterium]|nr:chitobiase/beta-hexosaminidase C-terminal domain-containing protein [Opitutaceae bacterium]